MQLNSLSRDKTIITHELKRLTVSLKVTTLTWYGFLKQRHNNEKCIPPLRNTFLLQLNGWMKSLTNAATITLVWHSNIEQNAVWAMVYSGFYKLSETAFKVLLMVTKIKAKPIKTTDELMQSVFFWYASNHFLRLLHMLNSAYKINQVNFMMQ